MAALVWYRVICFWSALTNLALVALGLWCARFQMTDDYDPQTPVDTIHHMGQTLVATGLMFCILNIGMAFLPRKEWAWALAFTNILTGILCCPLALLLVPVWLRPEVRAWFKEDVAGS
jgi:hypothetical protein